MLAILNTTDIKVHVLVFVWTYSFGHLMRRANSLEKTLMLGKTEGKRRGRQRVGWLESIADSMDMSLSKLRDIGKDKEDL